MSHETPAARRAGRPRSATADRAILDAARAAIAETGWAGVTLGGVAARAGVAKTTLYRRWPGKNELVLDALADLFDSLRLPDHGSLARDVEGVVLQFAELLREPRTRGALMAVLAEATQDAALRERIRDTIVDRQRHLVLLGRARAQARGELPVEPDAAAADRTADMIFDVIAGSVLHRLLVSAEPVTAAWATAFATLLTGGLAALTDPAPVPAPDPAAGNRDPAAQ
ncbi:TetR family transcriptional regulator [Streptomyces sp. WAC 06738]|uniref:TetR/AcrR family transcriptional regulator n=1 Tax=Streptomyces sp. WAC 06738 TaxID=2203210 RepID=UPI000F6BCF4F|nr:TetR/AcrR family transcriptional regulator [Streptomyces sp. WAC 06738]AZM48854.1 TetR family transcriptional regulator [Streptomyces sp. WAC 06738]